MQRSVFLLFGMTAHRVSADFAILRYGDAVFQLHGDGTYSNNPYLGLLPENPPRGAGCELRLYDSDPDVAAARALMCDDRQACLGHGIQIAQHRAL